MAASTVLKAHEIRLGQPYQAKLDQAAATNPGCWAAGSAGPAPTAALGQAKARLLEQSPAGARIEVICPCGQKIELFCEYAKSE